MGGGGGGVQGGQQLSRGQVLSRRHGTQSGGLTNQGITHKIRKKQFILKRLSKLTLKFHSPILLLPTPPPPKKKGAQVIKQCMAGSRQVGGRPSGYKDMKQLGP